MNNNNPTAPSFVFNYWKPWKENSNLFDSFLDYSRDTSLQKYGADVVGTYISQASNEQVQAINQVGLAIGRGLNVLSNQMSDINQSLGFLNRNMDIQIEQQKLSNLLLQNIAELLRVPDSEKERQHSIELGIKFFVNAKKDPDLYADALEELLKAESLMKQDYFVLHRIGCIYLYTEKYFNPEKALEYFAKAAKYASVESDPKAIRIINILNGSKVTQDNYDILLKSFGSNYLPVTMAVKHITGLNLEEAKKIVDGLPSIVKVGINKIEAEGYKSQLIAAGADTSVIQTERVEYTEESNLSKITELAGDSYERASFTAYVLGRFEDAVNHQSKALQLKPCAENRFLLAKYQARNGNKMEAIDNLDKCIEEEPIYAIAAFKEIDLINEAEVIRLITEKNDNINIKIQQLTEKWKTVESTNSMNVIAELTELLQKSYEIKVADFVKYSIEENTINSNKSTLGAQIDDYIEEIKKTIYVSLSADKIQSTIKDLELAKALPFETMNLTFGALKNEIEPDKLQIGSKYAGGIVIYIDQTGMHGLVCADIDFGKATWRAINFGYFEISGATGEGIADGSGMENTKKIVELSSYKINKGFFSSSKTPDLTAARLCHESKHNGYSDWYLPTVSELGLIYDQKRKGSISANNYGYWSSTESDEKKAYWYEFSNDGGLRLKGFLDHYLNVCKHDEKFVRAVRVF